MVPHDARADVYGSVDHQLHDRAVGDQRIALLAIECGREAVDRGVGAVESKLTEGARGDARKHVGDLLELGIERGVARRVRVERTRAEQSVIVPQIRRIYRAKAGLEQPLGTPALHARVGHKITGSVGSVRAIAVMIVFVLHPDLDVLAAIVGKMRDRGLESIHAAEAGPLIEGANKHNPAVLVIPERGSTMHEAAELAALRAALSNVPEVLIPAAPDDEALNRLLDTVTTALVAAAAPNEPAPPGSGEIRGDVAQVSLPDLLQLLSMGRKTGTLSVTTSNAAGEIRLADGEVVDAMFRRAEGMKAVIRLLGEREGGFHFAPDATPALRRIREPISSILMEGTRQVDEVRRLREQLGLTVHSHLLALHVEEPKTVDTADSIASEVADLLATPRTFDDLVDEIPRSDLEVLEALARLDEQGKLRRLPMGDLRPSLAGPEGMVVLRGLARRLRPRGYRGPGRLVLTGSAGKIRLARQAVARLAEAMPGTDIGGEMSADRLIEATAILQLGESVALEIITVVDRPDIAPLHALVLSGSIGVIALDRPSSRLAAMLEELEVALVDARSVNEDFDAEIDPGDPTAIAAVVRGAIEGMGAT